MSSKITSPSASTPSLSRRLVLQGAAVASAGLMSGNALSASQGPIQAVAFDGFTVFDPRPVAAVAEQLFPGRGTELMTAWRTRQFEYTWLRTLMNRYDDFWRVTDDALTFAAHQVHVTLTEDKRDQILQTFLATKAWPDALPALKRMKARGLRLSFLANLTTAMLDRWVDNAGLQGIFGQHLSTDAVQAFKPAPRAYQMGVDHFGCSRSSIVFAAFGGWDAAGAKAFGYPTFWVNRARQPIEELGQSPDGQGDTLDDLDAFLTSLKHPG
jgi:2-haloacid dehalogenase